MSQFMLKETELYILFLSRQFSHLAEKLVNLKSNPLNTKNKIKLEWYEAALKFLRAKYEDSKQILNKIAGNEDIDLVENLCIQNNLIVSKFKEYSLDNNFREMQLLSKPLQHIASSLRESCKYNHVNWLYSIISFNLSIVQYFLGNYYQSKETLLTAMVALLEKEDFCSIPIILKEICKKFQQLKLGSKTPIQIERKSLIVKMNTLLAIIHLRQGERMDIFSELLNELRIHNEGFFPSIDNTISNSFEFNNDLISFILALVKYKSQYLEQAQTILQQLVLDSPQFLPAHFLLGKIFADLNDYPKAISHFEFCSKHSYKTAHSFNNLGVIAEREGKQYSAIQRFSQGISVDFLQSQYNIWNVAILYEKVNKIEQSFSMQKYLLQVLELQGDSVCDPCFNLKKFQKEISRLDVLYKLASLSFKLKNLGESISYYQQLVQELSQNPTKIRLQIPVISVFREYIGLLLRNKNLKEAENISEYILKYDPLDCIILIYRAQIIFSMHNNRSEEAIECLRKVEEIINCAEAADINSFLADGTTNSQNGPRKRQRIYFNSFFVNGIEIRKNKSNWKLFDSVFRKSLKIQVLSNMVPCFIATGNILDAFKTSTQVYSIAPDNRDVVMNHTLLLLKQNEIVKACRTWMKFRNIPVNREKQYYEDIFKSGESKIDKVIMKNFIVAAFGR